MSGRATDWALSVRGIKPGARTILQLLCAHHNHKSEQCNPSIETLCEESELKRRAVLGHLQTLEAACLITRKTRSLGRGKGKATDFVLNMSICEAVSVPSNDDLQVQEHARAKEYTCKSMPLQVQADAPPYKEEPEENRKSKGRNAVSPVFQSAWELYLSCPVRASSQKKKPAAEQWAKAIKRAGSEERLLKALRAAVDARTGAEGFIPSLPHMHKWLRDDEWADAEREFGAGEQVEVGLEAWRRAMRGFVDQGTWPAFLGPKPGEPGCRVPEGMIRHWQKMGAAA